MFAMLVLPVRDCRAPPWQGRSATLVQIAGSHALVDACRRLKFGCPVNSGGRRTSCWVYIAIGLFPLLTEALRNGTALLVMVHQGTLDRQPLQQSAFRVCVCFRTAHAMAVVVHDASVGGTPAADAAGVCSLICGSNEGRGVESLVASTNHQHHTHRDPLLLG